MTSAAFGGVLALLALLAAPGSARADVIKVFNLFGEFDNSSVLSGTVTIDVTNGSATAIDASASGFEFKTITSQGPQLTEYIVRAASAGDTDHLYLAFGVGSLLGYGGSSLSPDTQINGATFLKGGGANPAEIIARSRAIILGLVDRRFHWRWLLRRSSRWTSDRRGGRIGRARAYALAQAIVIASAADSAEKFAAQQKRGSMSF